MLSRMIILMLFVSIVASAGLKMATCRAGEYLNMDVNSNGNIHCAPCPVNTFRAEGNHRFERCSWCLENPLEGSEEMVRMPCTAISDTVIGCLPDHYRHNGHGSGKCIPCRTCKDDEVEVSPCTEYKNGVCRTISTTTTDGKKDNTGVFACGAGERLDIDSSGKERCVPCPRNTYMSEENHRFQWCQFCLDPLMGSQEMVEYPCTSTSDTVLICIPGHFRHNGDDSGMCVPCRSCKDGEVEVSTCTEYTDRECQAIST